MSLASVRVMSAGAGSSVPGKRDPLLSAWETLHWLFPSRRCRLAGEDGDGFVLRLPTETRDGPVVAAAIGMSINAEGIVQGSSSVMVRQDFSILNRLNQAEAEHGKRNAKGQVARFVLGLEIRLCQSTGIVGSLVMPRTVHS